MTDHHDELEFELPTAGKRSRARIAIAIAGSVAVAFGFGYLQHRRAHAEVAEVHPRVVPKVEVIKPAAVASDRALVLPGIARALEETKIFARVTGYVRRWLVDIGDKVTAGQVLAEIDIPDVDAQLAQARAQLAAARAAAKQAMAQRDYSAQNRSRYETLADQKLISKSQVEQTQAQAKTDEATVAAAESNIAAQQANVQRLVELQSFAKVTAPFAGTITTRAIDRGTLISDAAQTPMFTLVATDPLRVFVDVPQTMATAITLDSAAVVTAREFPGRKFPGKITRAAGALDPELHVMTTEIRVPNSDGALLPGMYVQAALELAVPHRVVEIPATALYNDSQGLRVAVVDAQNIVHFAPITIEADTGSALRIATGLTGDERVLKVAVPSLVDGDAVEVVAASAASGSASAAHGGS